MVNEAGGCIGNDLRGGGSAGCGSAGGGAVKLCAGVATALGEGCDAGAVDFELRQPMDSASAAIARNRRFWAFIVIVRKITEGSLRFGFELHLAVLHLHGVLHGLAAILLAEL